MHDATDRKTPEGRDDSQQLRAPDARARGERRIVFEWELSDDGEGHRRLAVLTVSFRKTGINYINYERHPTEYIAGLRNEQEDTVGSLPTRSYSPRDSLGVCREATNRFSKKGLAAFAETAARELKRRYAASDAAVLAYFNTDDGPDPSDENTPREGAK